MARNEIESKATYPLSVRNPPFVPGNMPAPWNDDPLPDHLFPQHLQDTDSLEVGHTNTYIVAGYLLKDPSSHQRSGLSWRRRRGRTPCHTRPWTRPSAPSATPSRTPSSTPRARPAAGSCSAGTPTLPTCSRCSGSGFRRLIQQLITFNSRIRL